MALTRPRAYQIYDIDYKQAVRVITLTNITLAGGAPNAVDSVNLSLNDRVLVAGQGNGAQNGIYYVTTVGSGSNGTWSRSIDTDTTGELLAGTIVMVTEGTVYHDTQWKLTTNDPIVIGTTPLVFEQNSAFAFGNVYANGTAVLATSVGDVLTLTPGNNISITGNNTSKTVTIGVTGISLNSISNGTSNVNVVSSGGDVTIGIGGTSNIAVFSSTGANVTGTLGVSGNVTGGNLLTAGLVSATGNITGGNLNTSGIVSATGNINTSGALNINSTDGNYNVLNISGAALVPYGTPQTWQFFTNNIALGGDPSFILFPDSSTQTTAYPGTTSELSLPGNITGGNLVANAQVTATGNITGGNLLTGGLISATGNITGGNILGNGRNLTGINTFSSLAVTGSDTITAANIASSLTFTGDTSIVITANATTNTVSFAFGGSGESIFSTGGEMGLVDEAVVTSEDLGLVTDAVTEQYDLAGFYLDGLVGNDNFIVNTINGNILAADAVITTTGNITGGNLIASANLVSVGAAVSGNITGGNLLTAGLVSATGNITGGNLLTAGSISSTGAIYSNYNTNAANTASFNAQGGNTKGGTGYLDFISVLNTSASSNPYKWLRTTSDGQFQIINSAYTTNILNLTDVGNFSVPGTISVNYKQAVNGPAFAAYAAAILQTIPNDTQTKVLFQTEEYDTAGCYSSSRFTPNVEGYYQLNAEVRLDGASGTGEMMIILYKNGSEYKRGTNQRGTQIAANFWALQVSSLAYANGTTDYFEIYVQQGSGGSVTVTAVGSQAITWFNGCMLRGA